MRDDGKKGERKLCESFLGMATVAGEEPAQAQVHAPGLSIAEGGKRGACDVLVKSIAFCLRFSPLSVPVLSGSHF